MTTIDEAHATFTRWLGAEYDLAVLDAVLAAAAVHQLTGDPVWLLVISGSGNAKTETVIALTGSAIITSTITSEGALLSAASQKERAKDATGGLLRRIGTNGMLVIKDFTSILSMNRDSRATVLAALREVYDGRWERNVGTDGGRTLTWSGRMVLIGAVTTAYDAAHGVIAAMGDRFALVRADSTEGRRAAGLQALANVGREGKMRAELAAAATKLLSEVDISLAKLGSSDMDELLDVADLVTLARTAVERDYQGNVLEAHAPEMPTRFAKQLGQILRGGLALGMSREHARRIAFRVARDTMPPLRRKVLIDVADYPGTNCAQAVKRLQRPRKTLDRVLQELHLLGLLTVTDGDRGWRYSLAEMVDKTTLDAFRDTTDRP